MLQADYVKIHCSNIILLVLDY